MASVISALSSPRALSPLRLSVLALSAVLLGGACAHAPPRDLAPDPGLVARIQSIRIIPSSTRACPGSRIAVNYEAVLDDGSRVPFARSYDKQHPRQLHVVFLERESPDAAARGDGDWVADRDPWATVSTGFRLTARLRVRPTLTNTVVLPPDYGCMPHTFTFGGASGVIAGLRGGDGPDVTVRLARLRSPFYESLYVAGIAVSGGRPVYVLGDASSVAAAGWLNVDSQGGSGGTGNAGPDGMDGTPGAAGCPGQTGGQGWNGSDGGAGGSGGNGGSITIVVPDDEPRLARLVNGVSWGGSGGAGGAGGRGGRGGTGGQGLFDANNQPCANGSDGSPGHDGMQGQSGTSGWSGRTIVMTVPAQQVFGTQVPQGLAGLLGRR